MSQYYETSNRRGVARYVLSCIGVLLKHICPQARCIHPGHMVETLFVPELSTAEMAGSCSDVSGRNASARCLLEKNPYEPFGAV